MLCATEARQIGGPFAFQGFPLCHGIGLESGLGQHAAALIGGPPQSYMEVSMPPLAQEMMRIALQRGDQEMTAGMAETHYFDASEVSDLALALGAKFQASGVASHIPTFLPFGVTWIEFDRFPFPLGDWQNKRMAIRLMSSDDNEIASLQMISKSKITRPYLIPLCCLDNCNKVPELDFDINGCSIDSWLWAILAIINTPRLIGRKQRMPHVGLQRALARAKGLTGKFPLRAWTELKLTVSAIGREADGRVHEARLTGDKCLHWCRAHLRVRLGRLEIVREHERGNPALGIKQTRYRLAA